MDLKKRAPDADPLGMNDRGDIVLGWLTKLTVVLAALGVIGFDAISLTTARFQAEDHAQAAVREARDAYRGSNDLQTAYNAALAEVAQHGDTIDPQTFTIGPDGRVTLTLHRKASTMLVEKIPQLRPWTEVRQTVSAVPAS